MGDDGEAEGGAGEVAYHSRFGAREGGMPALFIMDYKFEAAGYASFAGEGGYS